MKRLFCIFLMTLICLTLFFAYAEDWTCPSCGASASGNFCNNCGTAKPSEEWVCPNCNNAVTGNFCNNCGTARSSVESGSIPTNQSTVSTKTLSMADIIPEDEIWEKTYDTFQENNSHTYEACKFSGNQALKLTGFSIDGKPVEEYHVFSDENALSAIVYLMPETANLSDDEIFEVAASLSNQMTEVLGAPDSQDKTDAKWKKEKYSLRIGAVKYKGNMMVGIIFKATGKPKQSESSDYALLKQYRWSSYGTHYEGLIIQNTSGSTKDFEAQVMFYDANNQLIGVGKRSADVIGNGQKALIKLSNESEFDHLEYTITAKDCPYKEIQSFVDIQVQTPEGKAILIATNNGTVPVQFVEYQCLFINGDQVVGTGWGFLVDDDSELKPGMTELREENCYETFDKVEVYYTGFYG